MELKYLQHLRGWRNRFTWRRYKPRMSAIQRVSERAPPSTAALPLVFTAADEVYFRRYCPSFVKSLVKHVSSPRLHVHLYNPTASVKEQLQALQREYPTLDLSWTAEEFNPETFERKTKASRKQSWKSLYICCSRFLAAREVRKHLKSPLLIIDVDVLFNGEIAQRFGEGIDFALMKRFAEKKVCKRTLGGVVYVSSSQAGQDFLDHTCTSIGKFLARRRYWFAFDQYALYEAVRYMEAHGRATGFSDLSEKDVSFDLAPDSLILFPKGKAKAQDKFSLLLEKLSPGSRGAPVNGGKVSHAPS